MKKILLVFCLSLFVSSLFAQTITEIKITDLPKNITSFIKTKMRSAPILRAATSTKNGKPRYYVAIEDHGRKSILLFDKNARLLDRKPSMEAYRKQNNSLPPEKKPVTK